MSLMTLVPLSQVLYHLSRQSLTLLDLHGTSYGGIGGVLADTERTARSVSTFGVLFTNYTSTAAYWSLGIGLGVVGAFIVTYVSLKDRSNAA